MLNNIIFSPISIEELEALIERIADRSIQKALNLKQELSDDTLLTTSEICAEFKISRVTINNYKKAGKLIATSKAGKEHAFKRSDCIKAFQNGHRS